jgi:hypothetical protein
VGPDRDFAKHCPDAVARIDGCRALSTDGELRLVLPIEKYLDCILVLAEQRVSFMKFWQFDVRQVLPSPAAPPDAVDLACEDLAGIKVERYFDWLPRPNIFKGLLKKRGKHVAIRFNDKSRDPANSQCAGHHARADLQIDDATIFRGNKRGIFEIVARRVELSCETLNIAFGDRYGEGCLTCQRLALSQHWKSGWWWPEVSHSVSGDMPR